MQLYNILDIAVVGIFVMFAVLGMKFGIAKMIFRIAALIIPGIAVIFFTSSVESYIINNTNMPTMIQENIQPVIQSAFDNSEGMASVKETLQNTGLPDFAIEFVQKNTDISSVVQNASDMFVDTLTNAAVTSIVKIFSILIIYIGIHILLTILIFIIERLLKDKTLGMFNRMLGATMGVINAMATVYILCAAVMLLAPITPIGNIAEVISQTFVLKSFYNNNLLMNILC